MNLYVNENRLTSFLLAFLSWDQAIKNMAYPKIIVDYITVQDQLKIVKM